MKPEEFAMLSIAYEGNIDIETCQIKFPKNIPDWTTALLDDYTKFIEDDGCYSAALLLSDNNRIISDHEKIIKISNIISSQKESLLRLRYLIPETCVDYADESEFLEFVHLFVKNITGEQQLTNEKYHGAESSLYEIFGLLTFITQWAKGKYSTYDDFIIFECDEKILPCEFSALDIESIGFESFEVLPFPTHSFSKIDYIKIPFTNVFKSLRAWYDDSKELRNEYIEFLRNETYLTNTSCSSEYTGVLILDAVRAYMVKSFIRISQNRDEDTMLAELFTIFSNGKYKLFIKELVSDKCLSYYRFIPATSTHSFGSSHGCFSEISILINHSSCWYVDINGNIVTTDIQTIDNENVIIESDDVRAVENCIKFQKMCFEKTPLHITRIILDSQLKMRKNIKDHSTLSYKPKESIKEIDLLMYYANYYIQNSSEQQNGFFDWWENVSRGVNFADGDICRNPDVIKDLFADKHEIIINSDDSINNKIWNIGLYGIYIFTLKCETSYPNTLTIEQRNQLQWIRYLIPSKIREIHTFPWDKKKPSNPLMEIAQDSENHNGEAFIFAVASLNIDTYMVYPVYQYLVRHVTNDMIIYGFAQLDTIKRGDFNSIYIMLKENLACNTVPMSLYRFAIITIREILSHRIKDIEKDTNGYLNCLRILDNKYISYREQQSLTTEYYSNNVISQEVGLKIINYLEMCDLAKQVETPVNFLEKDQIIENWNRIMLTRSIMSPDKISIFNESLIDFLNTIK